MQKTYCFVMASGRISPAAPIFKVHVGDSGKERKAWQGLCLYAYKRRYFNKPWSEKTEFHVKHLIFPRSAFSKCPCFAFQVREVSALQLWYAIANDCIDSLKPSDVQSHLLSALRLGSSPFSFVRARSDRNDKLLLTYSRKNLSPHSVTRLCDVMCPFSTKCLEYHVAGLCQSYDADDTRGFAQAFDRILQCPECDNDVEPVE